jgi:heterodisulfide reductase subunit C
VVYCKVIFSYINPILSIGIITQLKPKRALSMRIIISKGKIRDTFVTKVEEISGQNLLACYQCGKCSAGCPAVSEMDILPNQIIRFAQLGLKDELLQSKSIWICASCFTCNARCPKGINIAEIIEAIRQILLRKREDHLKIENLSDSEKEDVPPIAMVSSMRKFTS